MDVASVAISGSLRKGTSAPQASASSAISSLSVSTTRRPGTGRVRRNSRPVHYWTTFIKFGIGRATYDAAQEIRSGDITREEGVALVRRFDGEWPARFDEEIFRYLSVPEKEFPVATAQFDQPIMTKDYFLELADTFRSPHLWDQTGDGWNLKRTVWRGE